MEMSDREVNFMTLRPGRLLCIKCMNGGGALPFMEEEKLRETLGVLKSGILAHIRLETSFDEMGARTEAFFHQDAAGRRRDLYVLQRLGLAPGDIRISRDLYALIEEKIENVEDVCGYNRKSTEKWPACPLSGGGYYEKGGAGLQKEKDKNSVEYWKKLSTDEIRASRRVIIRPHHLLCLFCFIGKKKKGKDYLPLEHDNLYEVWMKMKKNPETPVTLVEGAGECMVCPPCGRFDNGRKLCFAACHLRDRLKDVETLRRLDMLPNETLSSKEIIMRIYKNIPDLLGICYYEEETAFQWRKCFGVSNYRRGFKKGFFEAGE